jgi:hypothetical protein
MHPSSLLPYYPTYSVLDEVLAYGNYKTLNIYLDLKNTLQTTYMEHAVLNILDNSRGKIIDTSVFTSLLSFLSFHKIYSIKRDIHINFYIFLENGSSFYHQNIDKEYKRNRKIGDFFGLPLTDIDTFFEVLRSNYSLMESVCNKIPSIKVIRLTNLEADFVPYYLITRNLVKINDDTAQLIYSNDHDFFQCISIDHCFIYNKGSNYKKILRQGNVMDHFLKTKSNISPEYVSLALSIIGDSSDNIKGVNGIGAKRFVDNFDTINKMIGGSMKNLYDNIQSNRDIFDMSSIDQKNKYINSIVEEEKNNQRVSRNMKLISFEILSRVLDDPPSTEMIDKRNSIINIIENNTLSTADVLSSTLGRFGMDFEENYFDILFFEKNNLSEST